MKYLAALSLLAVAAAVQPARLSGAPAPLVVPGAPAPLVLGAPAVEAVKIATFEQLAASELESIRLPLPSERVLVAEAAADSVQIWRGAETETHEAVNVAENIVEAWRLAREPVEAVKVAAAPEVPEGLPAPKEAVKVAALVAEARGDAVKVAVLPKYENPLMR